MILLENKMKVLPLGETFEVFNLTFLMTFPVSPLQTQHPAEDPCSPQGADLVDLPPLVEVVHPNCQELLLVVEATHLIFQRAVQVIHPGKKLQEARLLLFPTHRDQLRAFSHVGAQLPRLFLQDPGPPQPVDLHLLAFHQGGMEPSHLHQGAPRWDQNQDFLHLLLHPLTAADPLCHLLLEGDLHFLMTDPHLHQPLLEVIDHLCPVTFLLLPLPLSTQSLLPQSLPPLALAL